MFDAGGQAAGLAAKTFARHAFCSVVRREGSCARQFDFDLMDVRFDALARAGRARLA